MKKKTEHNTVQAFCERHNITEDIFYGFNPTVGGYLDLRSVTSLPDGFKDVQSWKAARVKKPGKIDTPKNKLLFWQDGKFVKADGIFTEVINKKGNVYLVKKIHSQKEFYLVTDGKTHAHGDTIKKAKEDFRTFTKY